MIFVTVFRRVPEPIIGTGGTLYDRAFETFEAGLDWLETTGILVERFDPTTAPGELARRPSAQQLVSTEGDRCLPLVLVNDAVVSQGTYLSRPQLARAVGRGRRGDRRAVARQLAALGAAAAIASDEELQSESRRARELGLSSAAIDVAIEADTRLRRRKRNAA